MEKANTNVADYKLNSSFENRFTLQIRRNTERETFYSVFSKMIVRTETHGADLHVLMLS